VNLYRVNNTLLALLSIRTFCQSSVGFGPAADFTIVDNMAAIINFDYSEAFSVFLKNISDLKFVKFRLGVVIVHINFIAQF